MFLRKTSTAIQPELPRRRPLKGHIGGIIALIVVAALVWAATQGDGWAKVVPGPTPNITQAIVTQNKTQPDNLDPSFGQTTGAWYATTLRATPLNSWEKALAFFTRQDTLPLNPNTTQATATAAMDRSIHHAQTQTEELITNPDYVPNLDVDMGIVGGTSAGAILTLAFIDATTAGDFTGGLKISGTGTINDLNEVGAVQGVKYKSQAVAAQNFDVFFVPVYNEADIDPQLEESPTVIVPIRTLDDAVEWLCNNGGQSPLCALPR